jgi:hypothetical protein
MMEIPPELEEDSEDFTDQECEQAIAVPSVDAMLKHLHGVRCPECEGTVEFDEHALRRRAPFFYARMEMRCGKGHNGKIIFRADWLSS